MADEHKPETQDWITLIEAESLTGYHPKYIKQLVAAGKVVATGGARGRGHSVRVSRASLLGYKARMDARVAVPVDDSRPSPASVISAFLAPAAPALVATAHAGENGYAKSRFWLTDSLDSVLDLLEMPSAWVVRKTETRAVGEMLRHTKVTQLFASGESGAVIARALGLEVANTPQPPQVRHGDTVIVARVSRGEAGFAAKIGVVVVQVLA